jgi:Domain of unknown function (DUF4349)
MTDETATIERDLAAVDAALASGAAHHEDAAARELQELALALQVDAPKAEPGFEEQLRTRVEAGFPREPRAVRRAAKGPRAIGVFAREVVMPLGGLGLALLLIVGVVLVAGGSSGHDDSADGGGGGGGGGVVATGQPNAPSRGAEAGADAGVAPSAPLPRDGGFAPGQPNRKIERSFSLELDVPLEDMARVADQVTAVTNRHGGFVLNSSVSSGPDGGGGDFSLRIPSDRLRPALRDLSELAPVIRQSQEGRDVTRRHVTAKDRLRAARAERRSLLRRLELADTDEEAEAIRRRLDLVAGEINGLRSQLRYLRLRTDYAVVTVSLLVAGDHDDNGAGVGGSFDDAMDDAGSLLVGFAGVLIRVLALAIPLGLIALAAWLGARAARRRRRESALA